MEIESILRCPQCFTHLNRINEDLCCSSCVSKFKSQGGVHEFLRDKSIAESFGFQWNRFPKIQLDSFTGDHRSRERFFAETQGGMHSIKGKLVLDAGCGSGRFSEIALSLGAHLVAVDASNSIFATQGNLNRSKNVAFVKASILNLPLKDESFDFVYCIGVLQHTSDPMRCVEELGRVTKEGGIIALTFYEHSGWWTNLYSKYLFRPVTKRLPKPLLLKLISSSSIVWFPLTKILFGLPGVLGKIFRFVIPVANYVDYTYSKPDLQKAEAILDTFDMHSPEFDKPIKKQAIIYSLEKLGFTVLDKSLKGNVRAVKHSRAKKNL